LMPAQRPTSPLFPYTTLFRSCELQGYVFDAWMRMAELFAPEAVLEALPELGCPATQRDRAPRLAQRVVDLGHAHPRVERGALLVIGTAHVSTPVTAQSPLPSS